MIEISSDVDSRECVHGTFDAVFLFSGAPRTWEACFDSHFELMVCYARVAVVCHFWDGDVSREFVDRVNSLPHAQAFMVIGSASDVKTPPISSFLMCNKYVRNGLYMINGMTEAFIFAKRMGLISPVWYRMRYDVKVSTAMVSTSSISAAPHNWANHNVFFDGFYKVCMSSL